MKKKTNPELSKNTAVEEEAGHVTQFRPIFIKPNGETTKAKGWYFTNTEAAQHPGVKDPPTGWVTKNLER